MHQQMVMDHFFNAMLMGEEIFKIYLEKATSKSLKRKIKGALSTFSQQKEELKDLLQKEKITLTNEYSFAQKNAILLEKVKTKAISNDFSLCLTMIHSLDAATIGGIKYVRKCDSIHPILLKEMKKILHGYNQIREKFLLHAFIKK